MAESRVVTIKGLKSSFRLFKNNVNLCYLKAHFI
ncbi:hypothetical protein Gotri_014864 [Gossypium trilobum]|uniref:Uncharacterized protein n=1 Tax=Gossypium trilobum TaxID=34281 RepID=A0A7J9DYP7_9ROSI|nr:hypothetical protein [Gossypium trilobum]